MEGPRGQNCYLKPRISTTPKVGESWRAYPTLRTPVPTLLSCAHPKDYGRRTTPSNDDDDDDDDDGDDNNDDDDDDDDDE